MGRVSPTHARAILHEGQETYQMPITVAYPFAGVATLESKPNYANHDGPTSLGFRHESWH